MGLEVSLFVGREVGLEEVPFFDIFFRFLVNDGLDVGS